MMSLQRAETAYSESTKQIDLSRLALNWCDRYLPVRRSSRIRLSKIKTLELENASLLEQVHTEKGRLEPISSEVRKILRAQLVRESGNFRMGIKLRELEQEALVQLSELRFLAEKLIKEINSIRSEVPSVQNVEFESEQGTLSRITTRVDGLIDAIERFNTRSRTHNVAVSSNHYRGIQLPILEQLDLSSTVMSWQDQTCSEAHHELGESLNQLETLVFDQIPKAKPEVEHAIAQTIRILDGLLTKYWYETRLSFKIGETNHPADS